jgi:cell division septum initiation protein DivIVA
MTSIDYKEEITKYKVLVQVLKEDNIELKAEIKSLKKQIKQFQEIQEK